MKGQLLDGVIIPLIVFGLLVSVYVGWYMTSQVKDTLDELNMDQYHVMDNYVAGYRNLQYMIVAVFLALWIASFISAFYIKSHPLMFPVFFSMAVLGTIVNALLSNVFYQILTSTDFFSSIWETYPWVTNILVNLPVIFIVLSGVVGVLMFMRGQERVVM